jgi:hypothetical protein
LAELAGNPVLTTAGRSALLGGTFHVAALALGDDGSWTAASNTTALGSERARLTPQVQVEQVGTSVRLHVVALDQSAIEYPVREFALLSSAGTVLLAHAQPFTIAVKTAQSTLMFVVDIALSDADAGAIQLGDTDFVLPAATTARSGITRYATRAEGIAGVATDRAVTPSALQAALDDTLSPWLSWVSIPLSNAVTVPDATYWSLNANLWQRTAVGSGPVLLAFEAMLPPRATIRKVRCALSNPTGIEILLRRTTYESEIAKSLVSNASTVRVEATNLVEAEVPDGFFSVLATQDAPLLMLQLRGDFPANTFISRPAVQVEIPIHP